MFAVMGVTGQVGSVVASKLLADDAEVRAVAGDPGKWREREGRHVS